MTQEMGELIALRRKEKCMTQKELADALHITDKAVSKWERGISCPDLSLIPRLAELLGLTTDELLRACPLPDAGKATPSAGDLPCLVASAVGMALGIAGLVLGLLGQGDAKTLLPLLSLGLACLGFSLLRQLPR